MVFSTLLLDKLGENIIFPLLPFILAAYSPDGLTLGLLAATATLFAAVANPVVGAISDQIGRRPTVILCVLINTAGLALFGFAGSLGLIFVARAIGGIGSGTQSTAQAYIVDISTPATRARNFGISGAAFGLGAIIGPALGGLFAGWSPSFPVRLAAALSLLNLVQAMAFLPESLPMDQRQPLSWQRLNSAHQVLRLFRLPDVNVVTIAFVLFNMAFSGFTSLLVLFLKQRLGWSAAEAGGIFVVVGITVTAVQVGLIGPLVKRHGEKRLSRSGLFWMAAGILLVGCSVLLPAPLVASSVVLASIALAIGAALVIPNTRSLVAGLVPTSDQGVTLGSLSSVTALASSAGPILAGLIYDKSNLGCFVSQAVLCLAAAWVISALRWPRHPVGEPEGAAAP
ncbi:MFS transporter [Synechococcus sp. RSCCF101]|uniref:MFS transporter n=1 Tax=Synechococcus sp. RSCCF101 TaxID=2511069 RepID=UPI0017836E28|nr:MFS transporter [Synechococcus sp. RSCCF101]